MSGAPDPFRRFGWPGVYTRLLSYRIDLLKPDVGMTVKLQLLDTANSGTYRYLPDSSSAMVRHQEGPTYRPGQLPSHDT